MDFKRLTSRLAFLKAALPNPAEMSEKVEEHGVARGSVAHWRNNGGQYAGRWFTAGNLALLAQYGLNGLWGSAASVIWLINGAQFSKFGNSDRGILAKGVLTIAGAACFAQAGMPEGQSIFEASVEELWQNNQTFSAGIIIGSEIPSLLQPVFPKYNPARFTGGLAACSRPWMAMAGLEEGAFPGVLIATGAFFGGDTSLIFNKSAAQQEKQPKMAPLAKSAPGL